MSLRVLACLVALLPLPALAGTLVATHPGLMCVSPDALATLTLPDGSSRAASPKARPGDAALARAGGCIDIPRGARVETTSMRKRTSLVLFDPQDGRGRRIFVAPNIDFGTVAAQAAGRSCLRYEVPLQLTGRITRGSGYGEDIHTGVVGWSHWQQITLDHPICTVAIPNSFEEAVHGIRDMQPILPTGTAMPKPGTRVTVVGKLFHADNGNQMTTVLIDIATLDVAR